jgi:cell division protein FtsB
MAKQQKKAARPHASLLTKLVVVALLAAIGLKLYDLREQVAAAEMEKASYAQRVEDQSRENQALAKDLEEGFTPEKVEEIARRVLNLVRPGEYIFFDTSN